MQTVTPQSKFKQSVVDHMLRHGNVTKLRSALRFDETIDPIKEDVKNTKERLDLGDVPVDDGKPPAPPAVVDAYRDSATGMGRIEFNIPETGDPDYVRRARVRYRRSDIVPTPPATEVPWTYSEADLMAGSPLLDLQPLGILTEADRWQAQAQFIDAFGRESAWVPEPPKEAVPEQYIPYLRVEALRSGRIKAEDIRLVDDPLTKVPAALTLTDTSFVRVRDTLTTPGSPFDRVKISSFGVELQSLPDLIQDPNKEMGSKIKPLGVEYAAMHFGSTVSMRGIYIRADGSSTQNGVIRLDATPLLGSDPLTNSAYLVLRGISGSPNIARTGPDLEVERDLRVGRDVTITGNLTVSGTSGGFSGKPEDLLEGILAGRVDLQLLNFTDPAGARIPQIVPLVSLRPGDLPAHVDLVAGNFIGPLGANIQDLVPLGSLAGGDLPIKIDLVNGNFRGSAGAAITELVPHASIESGAFADARIPDLAAGKITSGVFADALIPALAAGKITSGVFDDARIPNLAAGKTTSGVFADARIPVLDAGTHLAGGSVTGAKIANLTIKAVHIDALQVETAKINDLAVTTGKIAGGAVETAKIADFAITTGKIAGLAVDTGKLADLSVGTGKLIGGAVTGAKIDDSLRNPGQGTHGLRTIGSLLGGTSLAASAGDHSHGSGNTMDFDYLPDTYRRRSLAQRLSVRRSARRNGGVIGREEFRTLQSLVLTLAHILQDAPDLDAYERERLRQRGELPFERAMFEWRRHQETGDDGGYIHDHSLAHYATAHADLET